MTTALFEKCLKTLPHIQFINLYSVSECHDVAYESLNNYFKDNKVIHPYMMNGLSHCYHLGIHFYFRGVQGDFQILFHLSIKFLLANRIAPDGMLA